jgi:hypothetical protein
MTLNLDTGLRRVLAVDAVTCVAAGLLMAGGSAVLAPVLGLPSALLLLGGLVLFPIAGLMAWLSRQARVAPVMVWLIVLGNAAWVAGSLLVVVDLRPTLLGEVFVLGQGLAVAVLTVLEFNGLRRSAALSPV